MQPVADRSPRKVLPVACGIVLVILAALVPSTLQGQMIVPASQPLDNVQLELRRSDAQQASLLELLRAQQTPGSADYHKWLTPEQFRQRFAPDPGTPKAVTVWLEQQGLDGATVSRNGMRVRFHGTAAQVQRAFGVRAMVRTPADLESGRVLLQGSIARPVQADLLPEASSSPSGKNSPAEQTALLDAIEANSAAAVVIPPAASSDDSQSFRQEMLAEAAAQGITVLQSAGLPGDGANASVSVLIPAPPGQAFAPDASAARPAWQSAPGLPLDGLRAVPDAVLPDMSALSAAITAYAAQHGRIGPLTPWLYRFANDSNIFHHDDAGVLAGSWSAGDGLGTVNVPQLMRAIAAAEAGVLVTLSASDTTVIHGQALSLLVTVATNGGQPSGTATVTLKGRSGNTVTLGPTAVTANTSGGYGAAFSTSTLPGDVYDISATYPVSGGATVSSNIITTTVNPEAVALVATAPPSAIGATIPVTVTATSASGVGVPSGAVTVTQYGETTSTYTGTLPSSSTNSATTVVNVPATTVGKIAFQANCTSSSSFSCNRPTSFAVTVTQGQPVVTLTSVPQAAAANSATQKYDLAVSVASASGNATDATPTGTVTLQNNGTTFGTVALAKGTGTYTASLSGLGNSLTAVYNGDTNYAAATSAAVVVNAAVITTSTALVASPSSTNFGSSTSLTASVTPATYTASGAPTGTITFRSSLQGVIGTATLSNGYVTFTAAALQVGIHSITATYSGDGSYATSVSSPTTVTIAQGKVPSVTTLSVNPAQPLAGQSTTLTATVNPNFSVPAGTVTPNVTCTGQVTFFSNGTFVANGALIGGTLSVTAKLVAGIDSLTASYSGDAQCFGSSSSTLAVSTAKVGAAVTLQPSVTYANAGQTIQLKATVAGADGSTIGLPTGSVTFYDLRAGVQVTLGTAVLGGATSSTAMATINVNGSTAGQHNYSAIYSGDGVFLPATSGTAVVFFGDFNVSFNPSSLTIPRGGSGSAVVSVSTANGFNAATTLTCTPPGGSQITCSFQTATVPAGGSTGLTVTTTAQSGKVIRASRSSMLLGAGGTLAALLFMPFARSRRMGTLLVLTCVVTLAVSGCGLSTVDSTNNLNGGSTVSSAGGTGTTAGGTPLGTQLLTITAVSSDGTLTHTYTFPVTVQ